MTLTFTYTDEQRDEVRTVVRDRLGRDAVDRIERLWGRIERAARLHILGSALTSQTPGHKARIKTLTKLRDRAEALHDDILAATTPSFILEGDDRVRHVILGGDLRARYSPNVDPFDATGRAITTLLDVIDASIAAQRPQLAVNSSKAGRDSFWEKALMIWTTIGGAETGIAAAEFVIAVSRPVFAKVRADEGHKTTASMPLSRKAVEEWLRVRAKDRQGPRIP